MRWHLQEAEVILFLRRTSREYDRYCRKHMAYIDSVRVGNEKAVEISFHF